MHSNVASYVFQKALFSPVAVSGLLAGPPERLKERETMLRYRSWWPRQLFSLLALKDSLKVFP